MQEGRGSLLGTGSLQEGFQKEGPEGQSSGEKGDRSGTKLGGNGKNLHWAGEEGAGEIAEAGLDEEGGGRAGQASAFNILPLALVKPASRLSSLHSPFQASPAPPPPLLLLLQREESHLESSYYVSGTG